MAIGGWSKCSTDGCLYCRYIPYRPSLHVPPENLLSLLSSYIVFSCGLTIPIPIGEVKDKAAGEEIHFRRTILGGGGSTEYSLGGGSSPFRVVPWSEYEAVLRYG